MKVLNICPIKIDCRSNASTTRRFGPPNSPRRVHWLTLIYCIGLFFAPSVPAIGQAHVSEVSRPIVIETLRSAIHTFHKSIASHGGYVYHYSLDLRNRWGEGEATKNQIWVQPPGTPTVGMAFLRAFQATGDKAFLDAAKDAAHALVDGQLRSGGWTNCIDFDPNGARVSDYRNRPGRGKNNSSLDDGQTQSALLFLIRYHAATHQVDEKVSNAIDVALDALYAAQFPNGGFPQVWTGPVEQHKIVHAKYPTTDYRTVKRIKNYWDMYTLNDNVAGYVADTLIAAHKLLNDKKALNSLNRLGDFLMIAQMPEPQPGWAQQYDTEMRPIWARRFEPPGVSSSETMEVIATLVKIAYVTGDSKYLKPIPAAAAWLIRSRLQDGKFARYYELKTNRPLYMTRAGKNYSLTYDDSQLPSHYAFKVKDRTAQLSRMYQRVQQGNSPEVRPSEGELAQRASQIITSLDEQGRWVSTYDGKTLVGQTKMPVGTKYLSSKVFSQNVTLLSDYLDANNKRQ